jgi:hypothetical protein
MADRNAWDSDRQELLYLQIRRRRGLISSTETLKILDCSEVKNARFPQIRVQGQLCAARNP